MKQTKPAAPKTTLPVNPALKALQDKLYNAQKAVDKALAGYKKASTAVEEAFHKGEDKIVLLQHHAALKIARFTHKIKKTEHKLAKALLKATEKELKKAAEKEAKKASVVKVASAKKVAKSAKKTSSSPESK